MDKLQNSPIPHEHPAPLVPKLLIYSILLRKPFSSINPFSSNGVTKVDHCPTKKDLAHSFASFFV